MKRLAIAAAAAALLAMGSAHAQMNVPGLYGELGWTWLKVDAAGTSARPSAIRGIIGYDFHPYFAVEGFLAGGVSDADKTINVNGVSTDVNFKMRNMYGIWLKPKYTWNQAELFARLGYAHTDARVRSTNNNLVDSSQSDNDFSWGVGVNYHFSPRMYVGLDWVRYTNQSGHHADGMTLGLGYRW